jgi:rubrerythrin
MKLLRKMNRIRSRQSSKAKWYCGCDRRLVGDSGKCPSCGASSKGYKEKKATSLPGPLH